MDRFLITCEHGGNRIPQHYWRFFVGREALLATHRGYDPGALTMARDLARMLDAPLYFSTTSRLLIDLNRSIGHPGLYSEATRAAPAAVRRGILEHYYLPYRRQATQAIAELVAAGHRVIHVSSHSFTPVLDGEVRNADIGLLYDPSRQGEAAFCRQWQQSMKTVASDLRVRRNYPYSGISDGFTAYLRRRFSADSYLGIELEINQQHVRGPVQHWRSLREALATSLDMAMAVTDGAV